MITLAHPIDSYSFMAGVMAVLLSQIIIFMARDLAADQILTALDYALHAIFRLFEAIAWLVYYALYFVLWLPWRVWCWMWNALARDAGDFDRLAAWWERVKDAWTYRGNWD